MLVWLPWFFLSLAAAGLVILYPTFPTAWPCHWNAHGVIDGWSSRTPAQAAFPLAMAGGLALLLEVLAQVLSRFPNALPSPWKERTAQAHRNCLRWVSASMVLFMGYLACALPFGPPGALAPALLIGACILYPCWDFWQLTQEMRKAGALPAGYRGLIYSNPDDPRLWVPKMMGVGLTLNFAHPAAWGVLLGLLALPILLVLTLRLLT